MNCSIPGCSRSILARQMCSTHYMRQRRHGDPLIGRPSRIECFWRHVDTSAGSDGCWPWTAYIAENGYGQFHTAPGQPIGAHRFAYELAHGRISEGLTIDHLCRNKQCVNPAHLEAVTQRENSLRSGNPTLIAHRDGRCTRGHALTPENTIRKSSGRYCRICNRPSRVVVKPAVATGVTP